MATPHEPTITRQGMREYGPAFLKILTPEASRYVLALPKEAIDEESFHRLQAYVTHFQPIQSERNAEQPIQSESKADQPIQFESNAGSQETPSSEEFYPDTIESRATKKSLTLSSTKRSGLGRPREETKRAKSNDSWGNIRNISELILHGVLEEHWTSLTGDQPALPLLHLPQLVPGQRTRSVAEIFADCWIQLETVEAPANVTQIRWIILLNHLGFLVPQLRTEGHEISEETFQGLAKAIRSRITALQDVDSSDLEKKIGVDKLMEVVNAADRVASFCGIWGSIGVLFYLSREMNRNFVFHRMTRKGEAFVDMKSHLRQLGIQKAIEGKRTKELSESVTSHLNAVFSTVDHVDDTAPTEQPLGI